MKTQQVAETILEQLGGGRFAAITGACNFVSGIEENKPMLSMKLPQGMHMKIFLDASDTYTMRLLKISVRNFKLNIKVIAETSGIYSDMLESEFTAQTGLYTRL